MWQFGAALIIGCLRWRWWVRNAPKLSGLP